MYKLSYFPPPVAPYTDEQGRYHAASLTPERSITLEQVYQLITGNERLKKLTEELRTVTDPKLFRTLKAQRLPFITPCGTFSHRKSDGLIGISGLVVLDIDGLPSLESAAAWRDLFAIDSVLRPALSFVSPGGQGVKLLVPYDIDSHRPASLQAQEQTLRVMEYARHIYDPLLPEGAKVDGSGKDIARCCFLCHDEGAGYNRGG